MTRRRPGGGQKVEQQQEVEEQRDGTRRGGGRRDYRWHPTGDLNPLLRLLMATAKNPDQNPGQDPPKSKVDVK